MSPIGFAGPYGCANCGSLVYPGRSRIGYNSAHEALCGFCYDLDQESAMLVEKAERDA